MTKQAQIWALGGESHRAPEDTLAAYWGGIGAGADGLAITLQLTADGIPVCCRRETLQATCDDPRSIAELSWAELAKLDAGTTFRWAELDERNQPTGRQGDDTPWEGVKSRQKPLYHPRLDEVLLLFGRRTSLLLSFASSSKNAARRLPAVVEAGCRDVERFGLGNSVVFAGDEATLKLVKQRLPDAPLAYVASKDGQLSRAVKRARQLGTRYLIIDAERLITDRGSRVRAVPRDPGRSLGVLVSSMAMPYALTPDCRKVLAGRPWLAGFICRAVDRAVEMERPRHLIVEDVFAGKKPNLAHWVMGYSKANEDTRLRIDDGFVIEIKTGGQYSGGAAVTAFPIHGDFDARVRFEVESPHQGTTFEMACIQVDPGYHHMDNDDLDSRSVNLTFDVHGAPPYASSERDEDDGFRIGWNNGPAVTEFIEHAAQSSNIYNKYGRDVGGGAKTNSTGQLRLARRGAIFDSYYTDTHNGDWVLSGTALVPTLAEDVYLRIGAKHWPKRGNTPPPNRIKFTDFRLYQ